MTYRACAAVGISIFLLSALSSCASKPLPPPFDDGSEYLVVEVEGLAASLVGRERARLSGNLIVGNGSPHQWLLAETGIELFAGGVPVPIEMLELARANEIPGLPLPAASRERFTFSLECAVPPGDDEAWAMELGVRADLILEGHGRITRRALATASVPRIMDPVFAIQRVRIKQAELVNTRLLLDVSIQNPNTVALVFDSMAYTFYGEGRWWAESRRFEAATILARECMTVELELVMNFIDMKRSLLDQVIKMARIGYKLTGSAGIRVELEDFPPFEFPFTIAGESPVVK